MPRKNKNTSKHKKYAKPDYHSQNKKHTNNDDASLNKKGKKKNKLRTSYDVYKRLVHDPNIGIDLNYISIGYEDGKDGNKQISEVPFLHWKMIEDGGDIPMHRIEYFVLYLIDGEQIIIWEKKSKLDRLYLSGDANKTTTSLRQILFECNPNNVPNAKKDNDYNKYERDNKEDKEDDEGKDDENECKYASFKPKISTNPTIVIIDELLSIFDRDPNSDKYEISLRCNKIRVRQEPQLHTKLKRNEYKVIAAKTKQIMNNQKFKHPLSDKMIDISQEMSFSYDNSEIYLEKLAFTYLDIDKHELRKYPKMKIDIMHETTLDCAYRLTQEYGNNINIAMLNFSSAKNPGGGWDTGAIAQEESIARSSTLIPTLEKYQTEFYDYHKYQKKTMLYSHALIYSPDIIFMKHGNGCQIERDDGYYKCNVITSPAVNAGYYVKRAKTQDYMMQKYGGDPEQFTKEEMAWNVVENIMRERISRVFELAMKYDNKYLILGAWGCGVFKNEPNMIAKIFAEVIRDRYYNTFEHIVFAILDHPKKQTINKFIYEFEKIFNINNNDNTNEKAENCNDPLGKKNFNQYDFIK